jgi:polyisoprenoid-binding protein YceI
VKGPDFFDVEQFPQIHFVADTYTPVDNDGSFDMWGNLTIKGITHKIKLNVEFGGIMKDPWGNEKAGLTINGKINRKDWGLVWNAALETGGMLLADDVQIQGEIQLSRSL